MISGASGELSNPILLAVKHVSLSQLPQTVQWRRGNEIFFAHTVSFLRNDFSFRVNRSS